MSVVAVVLAGGRSRRLGTDKAAVTVGGVSLLERTLGAVAAVGLGSDPVVEARRLDGPLTAVAAVRDTPAVCDPATTHVLLLGCDHPFLEPELLRLVVARRDARRSVCIADTDGRVQYLLGVHPRGRLDDAAALVAAGERSLASWLSADTVVLGADVWRAADTAGRSLLDVDDPADLARAREIAGD